MRLKVCIHLKDIFIVYSTRICYGYIFKGPVTEEMNYRSTCYNEKRITTPLILSGIVLLLKRQYNVVENLKSLNDFSVV